MNRTTQNNPFRIYLILTLGILAFSLFTQADIAHSAGGAAISPKRLVIPQNERTASVTLTNTSDVELTYRMNLIEMGLDKNGRFAVLDQNTVHPAQRSVAPFVRFSPRQVRLKPGASQVVRAIVRRNRLQQGEYRSHLKVEAIPVSEFSGDILRNFDNPVVRTASSVQMGISIPVIVRHGTTDADVTIKHAAFNTNQTGIANSVSVLLGLEGNRSAFGDISVFLVNGQQERLLGRLKGFALYYPYPQERVQIALRDNLSVASLNDGIRLRVKFANRVVDSVRTYWADEVVALSTN